MINYACQANGAVVVRIRICTPGALKIYLRISTIRLDSFSIVEIDIQNL